MGVEDAQLLTAWANGDRAAGEVLLKRYYATVKRFFTSRVAGDPADLIQETFLLCIDRRDRLRERDKFRSFLFGIAYNVLRRHYDGRRREGERDAEMGEPVGSLAGEPLAAITERARRRNLAVALGSLPRKFQTLLELFYWESMTSEQIAVAMGEPHGTIRTRIRRARQLLSEAVVDLDAGSPASAWA